jgi:hypothetical protein
MAFKYDEPEMLTVAKAVIRFNKYAKGDTPANVVAMMKRHAESVLSERDSYLSIYGFVLTSFTFAHGEGRGIKASVAASLFD